MQQVSKYTAVNGLRKISGGFRFMKEKDTFESLGLTGPWGERLALKGIDAPAPIQSVAVPALLQGSDAVIRSRTGTGKTLAYLLPILERLDGDSNKPQAIVLAPTAELAMQIVKEASDLTEGTNLRVLALIGGASLKRQLDKLKEHPQLVVGTPGRILELLDLKKLKIGEIRTVVVDEADQTFALGVGGEAEKMLRLLPNREQTIFCSATMPEAAKVVVARQTKDAVWLEAEPEGAEADTRLPASVAHVVVVTEERDRIDTVRRIIRTVNPRAAMLFVNQSESIAEVEAKLQYHGLAVEAIYGDQPKQERTAVMRKFRSGKLKLLLATDVAARGLDATDVTHVIHVDPPFDAESYLHRAGRTGRMGRSGVSVLVLAPNRKFIAAKFSEQLGIQFKEMTLARGELKDRKPARELAGNGQPRERRERGAATEKPRTAAAASTQALPSERSAPGTGRGAASKLAVTPASRLAASPAGRTASGAASKPGGKPAGKAAAGKAQQAKPFPPAKERHRDKKNKGAPRWLKEKRQGNGGDTDGDAPKL
jgi:ATP-dependent RNA helicase DeaD